MTMQAAVKTKAVDGLWGLPEGWEWVPLGTLCESIVGGGTPDRQNPKYWGGTIPWASVKDLRTDKLSTTQEFITLQGLENSSAKVVDAGTVIVVTRMGLGKVCTAQLDVAINQDLKGLILSPNVSAEYLTFFLKSCSAEFERHGSGATVKGIKLEQLRAWPVPIPFPDEIEHSLETQRRIVARIEALLAEVKRARDILEQMRRDAGRVIEAALKELTNVLPPARRPLIEVIESKPRNGWSPQCDDDPKGIPVLKLGAVLSFRYNPNEFKRTSVPVDYNAHYWLQPGDILISRSNTPDLVGHTSIYTGKPSPCIYPDLLMRMRTRTSEASRKFLVYWLQTKEVRSYINSRASGASPTMKKIKQSDVCDIPFPVIDIDEQRHWAAHLDSIQSNVNAMMESLEKDERLLDQLEQSILERAFRGEL